MPHAPLHELYSNTIPRELNIWGKCEVGAGVAKVWIADCVQQIMKLWPPLKRSHPWSVLGISSTLEVAAAGWGNEVGDNFCSHRISLESFSDGGWSWQCDNGEEGDVSASIHPAEANAPITACTAARFSGIMHPDSPVSWEENPCKMFNFRLT